MIETLLQTDPHVHVVYKDIPILGVASVLASRALLAAQRQGGYARLQSAVMRNAAPSTPSSMRHEVEKQGLDGARLDRDMADPAVQVRLDKNLRLAAALHIDGTPALVIGNRLIAGAITLPELRQAAAAARETK